MRFCKPFKKVLCAGILSLILETGAQAQEATFQDWAVTCETDNYCAATTEDKNGVAGRFKVARTGSSGSKWTLSVYTLAQNPSQFGPTSIRIAGQRPLRLVASRDFASTPKSNEFYFVNSAILQPLFRRMIESRRAFVSFNAQDRETIDASYSLKGLFEALLWIDEQQDRVGSRREAGPPTKRESIKPVETAKTVDARSLALQKHEDTKNQDVCTIEQSAQQKLYKLNKTKTLVLVQCGNGPVNFTSRAFLKDLETQKSTLLLWAIYSSKGAWQGTDLLSNVIYDPDNARLSMQNKGRELGDCGSAATWIWQGSRFKLHEFFEKETCDGKKGDWPRIFPPQP